jgi:hypothetical protein
MPPLRSRITRTRPERSGPIRNPVTVPPGRMNGVRASGTAAPAGRAVRQPSPKGAPRPGKPPAGTSPVEPEAVQRRVDGAYTLIDDYVRRGREAAAQHGNAAAGRADMNEYRNNMGNPWGPLWPFIAPWMQAMQMWSSAMSGFQPGSPRQYPYGAEPYDTRGMGAPMVPKVSVNVKSDCPTEVMACVAPGADGCGRLFADPLMIDGAPAGLPLTGIGIECEPGHVRVRVVVLKDQPAGRYVGLIKDGTGCPRGDIVVEISR